MKGPVITDTGPLVALLNRREQHHDWAREQFALIPAPAITCEAVIVEAAYLLRDTGPGIAALMQLLQRGVIALDFSLAAEFPAVTRLLKKYSSVPMSLADACLVRMAEQHASSPILTLDSHFRIYRKSGRTVISTRMPR
jgi:predicted nucleic acid-binding protein